jgi:hypothetical protein
MQPIFGIDFELGNFYSPTIGDNCVVKALNLFKLTKEHFPC